MARTADGPGVVGPSHAARPRHTGTWVLRTNTMSFYLRSRLVLDVDALHATVPRAVLGIVPLGTRAFDAPLERLARVRITLVVHAERLLVAAALLAAAALGGLPWAVGVASAVVAVALLFLGVALGMRIEERGGDRVTVPICVVQRGVAGAAVRQIERALAARGGP